MVNVAHVAGMDGKCSRCGAGLGNHIELDDATAQFMERPWQVGERVLEYEMPNGRSGFATHVHGYAVNCIP
jgi:hypothetical protein